MNKCKKGGVDIGDYISLMLGAAVMVVIFILLLQNTAQKREEKKIEIDEKRLDIDSYDILRVFIVNSRQNIEEDYLMRNEPREQNKFGISRAFNAEHNDELAYAAAEYFFKYYGSRNMEWALDIKDSSGVRKNRIESINFERSYKRQSSISIEIPTPKKDFLSLKFYYREKEG